MKRCYNTMKKVYVYLHKCKSFPHRNYSRRAAAVTLCVLRCYGASAMGLLNGCVTIITSLSDWLTVFCDQIGLFTNAVHCDIGCLWHVHMIPHPAIPSSLHKPKKPSPCIKSEQEKNVAKRTIYHLGLGTIMVLHGRLAHKPLTMGSNPMRLWLDPKPKLHHLIWSNWNVHQIRPI